MNYPLITGKEVLDRLYSHLKSKVKVSATTLRKHQSNWGSICSFAQEQELSVDFSNSDSLQRFAYRMALDGKEDGLYFYREITGKASEYLYPGGMLFLEIGCEQAGAVTELMKNAGYRDVTVCKDLAGLDRVVSGRYGG